MIFHGGAKHISCFKKCRDSTKGIVNLAKIQSTREVSHHLSVMDNCQKFYCLCLCVRVLRVASVGFSKVQEEYITSYVDGTLHSKLGGDFF